MTDRTATTYLRITGGWLHQRGPGLSIFLSMARCSRCSRRGELDGHGPLRIPACAAGRRDAATGFRLAHDAARWAAAAGRRKENVAPAPRLGSAHSRPPWASMIERLIARPMPMP